MDKSETETTKRNVQFIYGIQCVRYDASLSYHFSIKYQIYQYRTQM